MVNWKQLEVLMIATILMIGVRTTLKEIKVLPNSHVGLIGLPSAGLIIVVVAVVSLLQIIFQRKDH